VGKKGYSKLNRTINWMMLEAFKITMGELGLPKEIIPDQRGILLKNKKLFGLRRKTK
jgi:hypothetical protein